MDQCLLGPGSCSSGDICDFFKGGVLTTYGQKWGYNFHIDQVGYDDDQLRWEGTFSIWFAGGVRSKLSWLLGTSA